MADFRRFFIEQIQDEVVIDGEEFRHAINVLRIKEGETVILCDNTGFEYISTVVKINKKDFIARVVEKRQSQTEAITSVTLIAGYLKGDKTELVVQKAVELGAYEIIPVATKRAVVKLDDKKASKKVERWNSIAEGGAKQSGRSFVPEVTSVMSFKEALKYAGTLDVVLIPYELAEGMAETKQVISAIEPGQSVGIFIGPEGGFETAEVEQAMEAGAKAITLGKRILRTETAGLTTLSILMYHLEG